MVHRDWLYQEPYSFDGLSYSNSLIQEWEEACVTVMAAVFSPDGKYLVCGSDNGRIAVWELAAYMPAAADDDLTPDMSFSTREGPINCLQFASSTNSSSWLLLCGSDLGVLTWPWQVILDCLANGLLPPESTCTLRAPRECGNRRTLPALSEVNALTCDSAAAPHHVIGACGDSRAHVWDVQTGAAVRSFSGHTAYLHCIGTVPAASGTLLATGADDGVLGLWDSRAAAAVALVRLLDGCTPQNSITSRPDKIYNANWLSSLQSDAAGSWLTVGGGHGSTAAKGAGAGFLTTFHVDSRRVSTFVKTERAVNAITQTADYRYHTPYMIYNMICLACCQ
jgi:THO complex subunit 6